MCAEVSIDFLIDKFWESIPPSWHRVRTVIRGLAAEKYKLSVEQFQVLRRIRKGIASVSLLAIDSATSDSAVSRAVDVLVKKGLVVRNQNASDRRKIPLTLTPQGMNVITEIYSEAEKWLADRFCAITKEDQAILLAGMEILGNAINQQKSESKQP